jgi:hypothetical protein
MVARTEKEIPMTLRPTILLLAAGLALAACDAGTGKADAPPGEPPAAEAETASQASPPLASTAETGLTAYVGKYPFDKVDGVAWTDHPVVRAGIAATVGDAAVRKAIQSTPGPAAPIEMHGDKIAAWACEQHNCGPHQWAVFIDPRTGATDVCYHDDSASPDESRWFLAGGKEEKRAGSCQIGD